MANEDKLVQVANVPTWLGPMAIAKLEEHGIEANLLEDSNVTSGGGLGSDGARIQVWEKDAVEAQELIRRLPL